MKQDSLEIIRHSMAHVLALAVKNLYSKAKFGIGPTIENGFYYDIDIGKTLSLEDLPKIEAEMKKIIKQGLPFKKKSISLKEAKDIFKKLEQSYKIELLKDLKKYGTTIESQKLKIKRQKRKSKIEKVKTATTYQVGEFVDLCRGPHVKNTKELPLSFKLNKVSGAYWRGKETNPMLQRIVGIAFLKKRN